VQRSRTLPAILLVLVACIAWSAAAENGDPFVEVAAEVGLDFVHFNGMSGRLYYPEVVGAGGALLD